MTPSYRAQMIDKIRDNLQDFELSMSARDKKKFTEPVKEMHRQLDIIMEDIDKYRKTHNDPALLRMK